MPFQIIKSNKALPPVDVLVRFEQTGSEALIKNPFRDPPEKTPTADVRVIPSPRSGIPSKYIYSSVKPASREKVAACYREIFEAIPQHGWHSVAVPLFPSVLPAREVYETACAAIREAVVDFDYDIYLVVDSKSRIQPETRLLSRIREFIDQQYVEPVLLSPRGIKRKKVSSYSGGSIPKPKRARKWPRTSASEDLTPPTQEQAKPGLGYKNRRTKGKAEPEESPLDLSKLREREERERETGSKADAKAEPYGSFLSGDVSFSKEEAEAREEGRTDAAPPAFAELASAEDRTAAEEELVFDSLEWPLDSPKIPDYSFFGVNNMIDLSGQPPGEEGAFTRFDPQAGTIRLDESFSQAVLRLIEERGLTDPQCYSRANLSRAVFNKLKQSALSPEKVSYKPSKSTALALAVALELGLDEAKDLLQKAGFALSHSSKGDIIVEYFLANHLYDIFELNEVLFKFGEPLLGSL